MLFNPLSVRVCVDSRTEAAVNLITPKVLGQEKQTTTKSAQVGSARLEDTQRVCTLLNYGLL